MSDYKEASRGCKELLQDPEREAREVLEAIGEKTEGVSPVQGPEISLSLPVRDGKGGVVLQEAAPSRVKIKLPLSSDQINSRTGRLKARVEESFSWLKAFCRRVLALTQSKFTYQPESTSV